MSDEEKEDMTLKFEAKLLEDGMVHVKINYADPERAKRFEVEGSVETSTFAVKEGNKLSDVLSLPTSKDEAFFFEVHAKGEPENIYYSTRN